MHSKMDSAAEVVHVLRHMKQNPHEVLAKAQVEAKKRKLRCAIVEAELSQTQGHLCRVEQMYKESKEQGQLALDAGAEAVKSIRILQRSMAEVQAELTSGEGDLQELRAKCSEYQEKLCRVGMRID